jgi:hypothetical protein
MFLFGILQSILPKLLIVINLLAFQPLSTSHHQLLFYIIIDLLI